MLIQSEQQVTRDVGFDDTVSFGIDQAHVAKIFKLLSTSTYKNSEESICREITSNAYDAMVEAGKATDPIYVSYDDANNKISFKDEGIGMSPEVINKIYTSLGSSTKDARADLIGGFGIGRFSVNSYTDIFYLDTIVDGVHYSYAISKNDVGLPQIDLMYQKSTDSGNGTTVSFNLKDRSDIYKFKRGIENQLKYFRTVIIEGFGLSNDYAIYQGEHFIYRPDRTNVDGMELCWGNIYYPIDWVSLGIPKVHLNCAIYFPTETPLKPTAARESLENTPQLVALIKAKVKAAIAELKEMWKEQSRTDDIIKWRDFVTPYITIGEHKLEASSICDGELSYKGFEGTFINQKLFKRHFVEIADKIFDNVYKKNSYSFFAYRYGRIGNYYHTLTNSISKYKLGRLGWDGCTRRPSPTELSEALMNPRLLKLIYDNKIVPTVHDRTGEWIEGPIHDVKKELLPIVDTLWKLVLKDTKLLDVQVIPKSTRVYNYATKQQVRGLFRDSVNSTKTLEEINKWPIVVYTNIKEEYHLLASINLPYKVYLPIFTAEKYNERLSPIAMTFEEFIETDVVKKIHKNCVYNSLRKQISAYVVNQYTNIHKMYHSRKSVIHTNRKGRKSTKSLNYGKFASLFNYLEQQKGVVSMNGSFVSLLDKKYVYPEIMVEHLKHKFESERLSRFTRNISGSEGLRYKLLYKGLKTRITKCLKLNKEV